LLHGYIAPLFVRLQVALAIRAMVEADRWVGDSGLAFTVRRARAGGLVPITVCDHPVVAEATALG
jgi:hypothetical protein